MIMLFKSGGKVTSMLGRDLTDAYFPYVEGYLNTVFGGNWNAVEFEQVAGYTGIIATNGTLNAHVEMLFNADEDRWDIQDNVRYAFSKGIEI